MTTLRISSGPLLWALHFAVLYGFTALACARGGLAAAVPRVAGVSTLALAAAAATLALRTSKQQFVDWLAAGLAAFSLLAMVWQALPVLLVNACE